MILALYKTEICVRYSAIILALYLLKQRHDFGAVQDGNLRLIQRHNSGAA
jgi:hypothetical protein